MSPSVWYANGAIFDYINGVAQPNPGRLYLDVGTREFSDYSDAEARSEKYTMRVRHLKSLLIERGYHPPQRLTYLEEKDARHREAAWRRRLAGSVRAFLTPPK
jgi:predicted alpha/beta superfamily hydrolase